MHQFMRKTYLNLVSHRGTLLLFRRLNGASTLQRASPLRSRGVYWFSFSLPSLSFCCIHSKRFSCWYQNNETDWLLSKFRGKTWQRRTSELTRLWINFQELFIANSDAKASLQNFHRQLVSKFISAKQLLLFDSTAAWFSLLETWSYWKHLRRYLIQINR